MRWIWNVFTNRQLQVELKTNNSSWRTPFTQPHRTDWLGLFDLQDKRIFSQKVQHVDKAMLWTRISSSCSGSPCPNNVGIVLGIWHTGSQTLLFLKWVFFRKQSMHFIFSTWVLLLNILTSVFIPQRSTLFSFHNNSEEFPPSALLKVSFTTHSNVVEILI